MTGDRNLDNPQKLTVAFDKTQYPREYKMKAAGRIVRGLAMAGIFLLLYGVAAKLGQPHDHFGDFFVGLSVFCLWGIYGTVNYRVKLFEDSIEISRGFDAKRIMREDIKGIRNIKIKNGSGNGLIIEQKNKPGKEIIAPHMLINKDEAFDNWFASLPSL